MEAIDLLANQSQAASGRQLGVLAFFERERMPILLNAPVDINFNVRPDRAVTIPSDRFNYRSNVPWIIW